MDTYTLRMMLLTSQALPHLKTYEANPSHGVGPALRTYTERSLATPSLIVGTLEELYELQSKLLKGGYIGDYIGDYYRAY